MSSAVSHDQTFFLYNKMGEAIDPPGQPPLHEQLHFALANPLVFSSAVNRVIGIMQHFSEQGIPLNRRYKITMCTSFVRSGCCPYANRCLFAHSYVTQCGAGIFYNPLYKTTLCTQSWPRHNLGCHFVHPYDLMHHLDTDTWTIYRPAQQSFTPATQETYQPQQNSPQAFFRPITSTPSRSATPHQLMTPPSSNTPTLITPQGTEADHATPTSCENTGRRSVASALTEEEILQTCQETSVRSALSVLD